MRGSTVSEFAYALNDDAHYVLLILPHSVVYSFVLTSDLESRSYSCLLEQISLMTLRIVESTSRCSPSPVYTSPRCRCSLGPLSRTPSILHALHVLHTFDSTISYNENAGFSDLSSALYSSPNGSCFTETNPSYRSRPRLSLTMLPPLSSAGS